MRKPKINVGAEMTKMFISVTEEEKQNKTAILNDPQNNNTSGSKDLSVNDFMPISKEVGKNRPKSTDKKTGEITKQIGFFITDSQNKKLSEIATVMNTNKSDIVREAIRMYFAFLEKERIV